MRRNEARRRRQKQEVNMSDESEEMKLEEGNNSCNVRLPHYISYD